MNFTLSEEADFAVFAVFLLFCCENAADSTDCPRLACHLLAILLFADDIALFSYSPSGLQKQLDILAEFCAKRGLTVNVKKTKTMVFEHANCKPSAPAFLYAGEPVE